MKSKVKSMLIIFFDIKGIVHKEFVPADQTVNSAYYCDVSRRLLEHMRRIRLELWRQKNWLLRHDNVYSYFLLHEGILFTKNIMAVVPDPTYFSLFLGLKIKLKGRHFDWIEVIEAETQAVLNTHRKGLPGFI
jgi:hypothetical protein